MSQEQYPDATPKREDGTTVLQPFAFTTGGTGDFRPMVQKVTEEEEVPKGRPEQPVVPVASVTEHAASLSPDLTDEEFAKRIQESIPQVSETDPRLDSTEQPKQQDVTSAEPVKSAPSLAGRAKSKESNPAEGSSQTSS